MEWNGRAGQGRAGQGRAGQGRHSRHCAANPAPRPQPATRTTAPSAARSPPSRARRSHAVKQLTTMASITLLLLATARSGRRWECAAPARRRRAGQLDTSYLSGRWWWCWCGSEAPHSSQSRGFNSGRIPECFSLLVTPLTPAYYMMTGRLQRPPPGPRAPGHPSTTLHTRFVVVSGSGPRPRPPTLGPHFLVGRRVGRPVRSSLCHQKSMTGP